VAGNLAQRQGGGIFIGGGIVFLDNSTLDGNVSAGSGGGLYQDDNFYRPSRLSLHQQKPQISILS
jgi:hypothetical protein